MLKEKNTLERVVLCSAVIISALFLIGMGTVGEKEPTKIPEPEDKQGEKL